MFESDKDGTAEEPLSPFRQEAGRAAVLKALHTMLGEEYAKAMKGEGSLILKALIEQQKATGGQTVPVDLPGMGKVATITLPMNQDTIRTVNDKDLLEWVRAWFPGELEKVERVRPAFLSALSKRVIGDYKSGDVFDPALAEQNKGEAVKVDGMKAEKGQGHGTPSVKLANGAGERIVSVVLGRTVLELTAAPKHPEPTAATVVHPDGTVIVDAEVVEDAPITAEDLERLDRTQLIDLARQLGCRKASGTKPQLRTLILERQEELLAGRNAPVSEQDQAAADVIGEKLIAKAKADSQ